MKLFGKGKSKTADKSTAKKNGSEGFKRDHRKATRFFEHASATADSRNYDYAIELYISGLRFDPDNLDKHEALYEVAKRRKVGGGKPAGIKEKMGGGKTPLEKMLKAELVWAKNPLNPSAMLQIMDLAIKADDHINKEGDDQEEIATQEERDHVNLKEVAYWVGSKILEEGATKPNKLLFVRARDLFHHLGAFDEAVESCRRALMLDESSNELVEALKDLEAERTMDHGGYTAQSYDEIDSRKSIRDLDKQKALEQDDQIAKTDSAIDESIERWRAAYEESPEDTSVLSKFVRALLQKEEEESENEAIQYLLAAFERDVNYAHKAQAGDIQIKQKRRYLRQLKSAADGGDKSATASYKQQYNELAQFELQQYTDRVKAYPTDLGLRFELGRRLLLFKKYDDAIEEFQQSRTDPKNRAASLQYLGSCYIEKGWLDEAIDTLKQGVEVHPLGDDHRGKELRFRLMDAYERNARKLGDPEMAGQAREIGSEILQTDINFKDIRDRMNSIRELVDELSKAKAS